MKTIRIKFVGFGFEVKKENSIIIELLSKHFNVVLSDTPDYVFCSLFSNNQAFSKGLLHGYCRYPQVRIMIEGENYVPDFNLADYAISSYPINFLDRHFSIPFGVEAFYYGSYKHFLELESGKRKFSKEDLKQKVYFANFLANHDSENNIRGDFFKKLSQYKRVESPGKLYHNNDMVVSWRDDSKVDFQAKSKFTLCFESTKNEGFTTEKIIDAFYAGTIPVYYGSSTVKDIINPKAYIDVSDYKTMDEAIERIKQLDNDDELYMEMMREPIFINPLFQQKLMKSLEDFLVHIFEQSPEDAFRRSRLYTPKLHEDFLLTYEKKAFNDIYRWPLFKKKVLSLMHKEKTILNK